MESSDPANKYVKHILNDEVLAKEFDLDKRKFSRNYEGSFYLDKLNTGAKVSVLPQNVNVYHNADEMWHYMGLFGTIPVFWVSDKVRFKPACSATETSWKIELSLLACLDMIISKRRITKAGLRFVVRKPPKTGFLASRPIWSFTISKSTHLGVSPSTNG